MSLLWHWEDADCLTIQQGLQLHRSQWPQISWSPEGFLRGPKTLNHWAQTVSPTVFQDGIYGDYYVIQGFQGHSADQIVRLKPPCQLFSDLPREEKVGLNSWKQGNQRVNRYVSSGHICGLKHQHHGPQKLQVVQGPRSRLHTNSLQLEDPLQCEEDLTMVSVERSSKILQIIGGVQAALG